MEKETLDEDVSNLFPISYHIISYRIGPLISEDLMRLFEQMFGSVAAPQIKFLSFDPDIVYISILYA